MFEGFVLCNADLEQHLTPVLFADAVAGHDHVDRSIVQALIRHASKPHQHAPLGVTCQEYIPGILVLRPQLVDGAIVQALPFTRLTGLFVRIGFCFGLGDALWVYSQRPPLLGQFSLFIGRCGLGAAPRQVVTDSASEFFSSALMSWLGSRESRYARAIAASMPG